MTGHLTPERSNPILLWCKNSPNWILPTVCKQIKAIICFCRLFFLPVHSSCTTSHCKDVLYLASIVLVPSHKWQSRGQCHRTKRYGSRQKKNTQKNSPRVFRFHPKKRGKLRNFIWFCFLFEFDLDLHRGITFVSTPHPSLATKEEGFQTDHVQKYLEMDEEHQNGVGA